MPKAYVIVDMNVTDPERYAAYRELAAPTVEAAGGRYLARGGAAEVFEGDRVPHRTVILEFSDMQSAGGHGTTRPRISRPARYAKEQRSDRSLPSRASEHNSKRETRCPD